MLTQINTLVNGSSNFAKQLVGTPAEVRNEIANAVHAENPESITIEIDGMTFTLAESHSKSGKTWRWEADITEEQFIALTGNTGNYAKSPIAERNSYTLAIEKDCTVNATISSGRSSYFYNIRESRITIKQTMARFTLKASEVAHHWVVFDAETHIKCIFREGDFLLTQRFDFDPVKTPVDAQVLARAANEIAQWLIAVHPELLNSTPTATKQDARKAVGRAIKQAREARGLTVRELARLTGIANNHISRIEVGRYNFTVDSIALLAKALGMDSVPLV